MFENMYFLHLVCQPKIHDFFPFFTTNSQEFEIVFRILEKSWPTMWRWWVLRQGWAPPWGHDRQFSWISVIQCHVTDYDSFYLFAQLSTNPKLARHKIASCLLMDERPKAANPTGHQLLKIKTIPHTGPTANSNHISVYILFFPREKTRSWVGNGVDL